jgi:hypothetical protein
LAEVGLEGAAALGGLGQGHPERLEALRVLGQGHDSGDALVLPGSVTDDQWQCDAPRVGVSWCERQGKAWRHSRRVV